MGKFKDFLDRGIKSLEARGMPRALQGILILGLAQGLLYTFIVPPWWHNDEPGHFEYAWLIANRPELLKKGGFDESMRRQLAASMLENHYYDFYRTQPDLTKDKTVYIGAPQTDDPPLYYWLVSLPLRLLKNFDFGIQNRAGRLVSVLIFLATLVAAWKAIGVLTGEGHLLQWMTVLFMALLPGFADTMTAVSNDVAATLAFSAFIWVGVSIIRNGFNRRNILSLIGILIVCYYAKNTALPAFPLALIVILFGLLINKPRWILFGILGLGAGAAILFSVQWGDSSLWYRASEQIQLTRAKTDKRILGDYVIQIQNGSVEQFITTESLRKLRNKTVTVGAWMWSSKPVEVHAPSVRYFDSENFQMKYTEALPVFLTAEPKFVSRTIFIANEASRAWIVLDPGLPEGNGTVVYYDGIILVPNEINTGAPVFLDSTAAIIKWDGKQFENLARNPSAEKGWLIVNPQIVKMLRKLSVLMGSANIFLATLQDPDGIGSYYILAVQRLFVTFWGNPARAKVSLLGGSAVYGFLAIITGIGLAGLLSACWRKRRELPWEQITFWGIAFAFIWIMALMRGGIELSAGVPLLPWARYAFPAIIPTALLLCVGWHELLFLGKKYFTEEQIRFVFPGLIGGIDIFAVLSILDYFSWKNGQIYILILIIIQFALYAFLSILSKRTAETE
jgi:hypothetical protein